MGTKTLIAEKSGQRLKVDFYPTDTGYSATYYVNESIVKQDSYPGMTYEMVEQTAQSWIDGMQTLNG
jgi:hypothetical protein